MRKTWLVFIFALAACTSRTEEPRPAPIGKANPAAVYCLQKGGERVPVQSPQGVRTVCKLSSGEMIDEWQLWRRDHPESGS